MAYLKLHTWSQCSFEKETMPELQPPGKPVRFCGSSCLLFATPTSQNYSRQHAYRSWNTNYTNYNINEPKNHFAFTKHLTQTTANHFFSFKKKKKILPSSSSLINLLNRCLLFLFIISSQVSLLSKIMDIFSFISDQWMRTRFVRSFSLFTLTCPYAYYTIYQEDLINKQMLFLSASLTLYTFYS